MNDEFSQKNYVYLKSDHLYNKQTLNTRVDDGKPRHIAPKPSPRPSIDVDDLLNEWIKHPR